MSTGVTVLLIFYFKYIFSELEKNPVHNRTEDKM